MALVREQLFIGPFTKHEVNPILVPQPKSWFEHECVYNAAAVVHEDRVCLVYRAEGRYGEYISRLGLATSLDGIHFERCAENPVMGIDGPFYDMERRGCEDPRVIKIDDTFYMTYTSWDGRNIHLSMATSTDLIRWQKHGSIIPGTKSGAILPQKVNGRYVMYFGDTNIWCAYSEDLLHWNVDENPVLRPRPDHFDSVLIEPGPPPLLTDEGILLIYNSSDGVRYAVGQALFDRENPKRLLARTKQPVIVPSADWEKYGKVNHVVFAEGLVRLGDTWHLYYGGADKCIGVATAPAR